MKTKENQYSAPFARILAVGKLPECTISLVPQKNNALSESELKKLLGSMKLDFEAFKKDLRNQENKNFNLYQAIITNHQLTLNIPDSQDRQKFIARQQAKNPMIKFITGQPRVTPLSDLSPGSQPPTPRPFKMSDSPFSTRLERK